MTAGCFPSCSLRAPFVRASQGQLIASPCTTHFVLCVLTPCDSLRGLLSSIIVSKKTEQLMTYRLVHRPHFHRRAAPRHVRLPSGWKLCVKIHPPAEVLIKPKLHRCGAGTLNRCYPADGHGCLCVCTVSSPAVFGALPIAGPLLSVGWRHQQVSVFQQLPPRTASCY